jgi:peptidoglycan hydrolase CwlO-like protein
MAKLIVVHGPMDPKTKARILAQEAELTELVVQYNEIAKKVDALDGKLRSHYRKYPDHWDEVKALWGSGQIERPGILY